MTPHCQRLWERSRLRSACLALILAGVFLVAGVDIGSASAAFAAVDSPCAVSSDTASASVSGPLRKGPYLMYAGDPTRMAIMWQTTEAIAEAAIEWGYTPAYGHGPQKVLELGGEAEGHLFRCDLTGLQPGALVYYQLTVGEQSLSASFRAAPPEESVDATLYAISDTQDNPEAYSRVVGALLDDVGMAPATRQSICLHAGDFVSTGLDEQSWDKEFFTREYSAVGRFLASLPIMGTLGNHEGYAPVGSEDYPAVNGPLLRAYWPDLFSASPSHFYYSFDYGPVHVTVLDTWTCAFDPGSEEYAWLSRDLTTSTKTWKIVMLHNPAYSAGSSRNNAALIRQHLCPLFRETGVATVLAGHDHFYSRCDVGGIQYLTLGGGGGDLSEPVLSAPYVVKGAAAHHFVRLEVKDDTLTGTAIGTDGSVLDSFVLARSWTDLAGSALASYGVSSSEIALISNGYPDRTWRPSARISRAQFVKMAAAAFVIDRAGPVPPSFSDVARSDPYYNYIEGAHAVGLVNGVGGGLFSPDSAITREQAVGIIARQVASRTGFNLDAMTEADITAALAGFGDAGSISSSLETKVAFAAICGIIKGSASGELAPKAPVSRIAAAALLIRAGSVKLAGPIITALTPGNGDPVGGTAVTITGANLNGATAVAFGSTAATSFTVVSDTQITAVSPAGVDTVDVTVTTPGGISAASSASQFRYYALEVINGRVTKTYTRSELEGMVNVRGYSGFKKGSPPYAISFYEGVSLLTLLGEADGLTPGHGLHITCSDGYVWDYTYEEVTKCAYEMWDPKTGESVTAINLQMVLALRENGASIGPGYGLRIMLLSLEPVQVTMGKNSPYLVATIEVQ